jgi:hypothetical protein
MNLSLDAMKILEENEAHQERIKLLEKALEDQENDIESLNR